MGRIRTCEEFLKTLIRAKIWCLQPLDHHAIKMLLLYTSWVANELKQFERNVITTLYLHPESNRDALQQGIFLPHYVTIAKQCPILRRLDFHPARHFTTHLVCCSLEYIFTILKFLQVSVLLDLNYLLFTACLLIST